MNKAYRANDMLYSMFSIFDNFLYEQYSNEQQEPQVRRKCWTPYCSDCGRCMEEGLQEFVDREG